MRNILKFLFSAAFLVVFFIHDTIENKWVLNIKKAEFSKENFYDISSTVGEFLLAGASYKIFVYNSGLSFNIFAYNAVFIGGSIVVKVLKHYIQEERPDGSNNNAFPSGHSFISIVSLLFIFLGSKKKLSLQNFSFCLMGVLVSLFRVLAIKHFAHDVAAGMLIGLFSFLIGMKISKYLYKKFFEKIFQKIGF